jgi:putative peptide zinc metalloprotease protein
LTDLADAPTADKEAPAGDRPQIADDVELIGEMEGSGFKEAPSIVRRGDGQVIQLTPLLYAVAARANGTSSLEEIAAGVGDEIGRGVSADNVRTLIDKKLRPLGILKGADGSEPAVEKSNPLLALNLRAAVIPERLSNVLAAAFQPLFTPLVVLPVLVAFVLGDIWLFGTHGIAQAMRNGIDNPATFLPILAAVVVSAGLHEIGHAAACRYGGGTPGKMGCGLYLAWPAFYTDVTDAYRLGKRGRLRTDLGGVYFNVLVVLATLGIYFATGSEVVLLLVVIQHFEIVHQLLPVVRLDGYYIVADLTGVPDLFARIKPILVSALPWNWRRADDRVRVLKPWVRVAVTAWVLLVVPLLLFQLLTLLLHLPRIVGSAVESGGHQVDAIQKGIADGSALAVLAGVLQLVALSIPMIGILFTLVTVARRVATAAWTKTEGRPVGRVAVLLAGGGLVALLLSAWLPGTSYRPIQPGEKGTLGDSVTAARRLSTGRAPLSPPPPTATSSRSSTTPTTQPTGATSTSLARGTSTTLATRSTATTTRAVATTTPTRASTSTSSPATSSPTSAP